MRHTLLHLEKSPQGCSFSHQTSTFEQCSKPLLMIGDYTSQYSEDLQLLRNSKIGSPSHGWHGLKVAGITNDFEAIGSIWHGSRYYKFSLSEAIEIMKKHICQLMLGWCFVFNVIQQGQLSFSCIRVISANRWHLSKLQFADTDIWQTADTSITGCLVFTCRVWTKQHLDLHRSTSFIIMVPIEMGPRR